MYAELKRKVCTKCLLEKDLSDFQKRKERKSGYRSNCRLCCSETDRKHAARTKSAHTKYEFERSLKRFYGITSNEYFKMLESQNGKCACCGALTETFKRRLHVDHNHVTGQVRELLCTKCNPGIGYFDDSIEKLEMAIAYLKKFKKLG